MENTDRSVSAAPQNELFIELKRLEKLIQELETAGHSYHLVTSKYTQGNHKAEVNLSEKDRGNLVRDYNEIRQFLAKTDKAYANCIEKLNAVLDKTNKRKVGGNGTSSGGSVALKRFKGPENHAAQHALAGREVAARISKDKEVPEEWILASIVRYLEDEKKFEVEDEDPGDESDPNPVRRHYKLAPTRLILLPNPNERIKEFSKGTQVLAMFPDTTSFYPATVVVPPKKKSPDYLLQFVDDDDEAGLTPQRKIKPKYVVARIDTLSRGD